MAPNYDDFFEGIIDPFAKEVMDLGCRDLWACTSGALLGRFFLLQSNPRVIQHPDMAMVKALEYFSQFIRTKNDGPPPSIDSEETSAELCRAGLVNILFGCIRDPETLEDCKHNVEELRRIYNGFREFVEYLSTAIGRRTLENRCKDPILGRLFSTLNRAATSASAPGNIKFLQFLWLDEIRFLAWETRNSAQNWGRMPHTRRILEYLRWEIRGRRDLTRSINNSWLATRSNQPTQSPSDDLSRLSLGNPSAPCAYCSATDASLQYLSCKTTRNDQLSLLTVYCNEACLEAHSAAHAVICREARDIYRSEALFQVVFEEFLRFTRTKSAFTVSEKDGVVTKWYTHRAAKLWLRPAQPLDFGKKKVQAALHSLCCNATQTSAEELREYFIRPFCTTIEFVNFVPRNAQTTVMIDRVSNISPRHTVCRLTTSSGLQFAFDPTAAQFGWQEHLAPWDVYEKQRVDLGAKSWICEPLFSTRWPTIRHRPEDHWRGLDDWKSTCAAEEMKNIVDRTLSQAGLSGVLALPRVEFERHLEATRKDLKDSVARSAFLKDLYRPDVTYEQLSML